MPKLSTSCTLHGNAYDTLFSQNLMLSLHDCGTHNHQNALVMLLKTLCLLHYGNNLPAATVAVFHCCRVTLLLHVLQGFYNKLYIIIVIKITLL